MHKREDGKGFRVRSTVRFLAGDLGTLLGQE